VAAKSRHNITISSAAGHEPRTLERYAWPGGSNRELPDASTFVTMQLSCPSVCLTLGHDNPRDDEGFTAGYSENVLRLH
jgi:hypothetical protein